jgi:hypothetical protein
MVKIIRNNLKIRLIPRKNGDTVTQNSHFEHLFDTK